MIVLLAACSKPAAPIANQAAAPAANTVELREFGSLKVDKGDFQIIDKGTGDGRVHWIVINQTATKTSWDDKPGRSGLRTETFPISKEELAEVSNWWTQLWPIGKKSFAPAPDSSYRWAVVMQKGDEVHVVEGGAAADPRSQPDIIESVVDFLDMHF